MGITALSTVAQGMVNQHQRQHGLGNGRRPNAHTGVVAAKGLHRGGLAVQVNGLSW